MVKCPNESKSICSSNVCDGIEDCSNGEDEHQDCLQCTDGYCKCKDGSKDIHQNYLCKHGNQCPDDSDERQCILTNGTVLSCPGNGTCNYPNGYCDTRIGQCVCYDNYIGSTCEGK